IRVYIGTAGDSFWPSLHKLWRELVEARLSGASALGDALLHTWTLSLSKFTRNLVASVPSNQISAYDNEPYIRRLLHWYTSWTAVADKESVAVARMLTQTLSNLVTGNENLMMDVWDLYLSLAEEQVVLLRLLASPDHGTMLASFVFIFNVAGSDERRLQQLCEAQIGLRICVLMLDAMIKLHDADESSEGGKAFDYGYLTFSRLISAGCAPQLYDNLAMQDENITPQQTTFLKLVDSYLQTLPDSAEAPRVFRELRSLLSSKFFALSFYAQRAIMRALGSISDAHVSHPPTELDMKLLKVCEALVLVTQCIVTIALEAEPRNTSRTDLSDLKTYFIDARDGKQGLVETLIETLRLLDAFLPRINFGKPVTSSGGQTPIAATQEPGFSYLKRDLVRLLGILAHRSESVQNRVRACGGIEVVMNQCVIDERNPYLREHAIFTLRNLLECNAENQAVVDSTKLSKEFVNDGMLKDVLRTSQGE
ncbi:hypothetical protein FISHEDRAFT_34347, partial [Fistulina hepatica ATCC 64428]